MPLDRSHRLTDQTVAMNGPDDIGLLFAALERLPERGFFTEERAKREVAEESSTNWSSTQTGSRPT